MNTNYYVTIDVQYDPLYFLESLEKIFLFILIKMFYIYKYILTYDLLPFNELVFMLKKNVFSLIFKKRNTVIDEIF